MEEPSDPGLPDWSALPADLLVRILAILEIPDLVSSGAVCRSWNLSYLAVRRLGLWSPRRQPPCLLYSSAGRGPGVATLRSLSTGRRYHVTLPDDPPFRARHVVGCSRRGWLVAADDRSELHLENPITRSRVALPPVATLAPVRPFFGRDDKAFLGYAVFDISPESPQINTRRVPPNYSVEATRRGLYLRAFLSSDPGDGTVVLLHRPHNQLSFARPGDTAWTWIAPENNCYCKFYHDCFHDPADGLFYGLQRSGEVHSIDLNGSTPVVKSIFPSVMASQDCTKYVVRAPWGDLLQIWRTHQITGSELRTCKLIVYKMFLAEEELHEIKDLKGHALFIGFNESFVDAKEFPMLTPNCVYLAHDNARYDHLHGSNLQEVVMYNVLDGSFSDFSPPPNSWLNLPPPIWIRPSCSDKA